MSENKNKPKSAKTGLGQFSYASKTNKNNAKSTKADLEQLS